MQGKIIKGIAGFYYVHVAGSGVYECKAKGIFRKDGVKPLVGDDVEMEVTHEKEKDSCSGAGSVHEPDVGCLRRYSNELGPRRNR